MPAFSDHTRPKHREAYSADGCGDFPKQWRMGRKRVEAFYFALTKLENGKAFGTSDVGAEVESLARAVGLLQPPFMCRTF
jgi:hypothetical protein